MHKYQHQRNKKYPSFKRRFRPYERIDYPEYNNLVGYIRNDYRNVKITLDKKNSISSVLLDKEKKENFNSFKLSSNRTLIENTSNSFKRINRYLYFYRRYSRYKKLVSISQEDIFGPNSSWRDTPNKIMLTWDLYKYEELLKQQQHVIDLYFLMRSKDGLRISRLMKLGRIPKKSFFSFKKKSFFEQIHKYKSIAALNSTIRANATLFRGRIRKDWAYFYKPTKNKKRPFIINGLVKIWRRLTYKPVSAFLGNRKKGEINRLAHLAKQTDKNINSSGAGLKTDSRYEYLLSNLVYKLKIAPSPYLAIKYVRGGFISVNNKTVYKPDFLVPPCSLLRFRGNIFYNFLFSIFFGQDIGYDKFAARNYLKSSTKHLSRFRIPSYLEVSFKLQEAILLRTTNLYEQPSPFFFQKTNIPGFMRMYHSKKGMGVF